ncbi:hypothetical protein EC973_002417 [Apophysomyces ossiformis]|uniref:Calcium-transporting ATPase n=1 Tax=Apophysomyces ossiformis TaxID=679940 RepID=A0A8H7BMP4_9FUNG|nr:hypothetical protein EC973_002417 [Apophysomyces ossiformis]
MGYLRQNSSDTCVDRGNSNSKTRHLSYSHSSDSFQSTAVDMQFSTHGDLENPFLFSRQQLAALVNERNLDLLQQFGGATGVAAGLHSDVTQGISNNEGSAKQNIGHERLNNKQNNEEIIDFATRRKIFGSNCLPQAKPRAITQLMWAYTKDKTLILLVISAAISLSVGIYEDMTTTDTDPSGKRVASFKWLEGVAILFAVLLVVVIGSINNYQKEKRFRMLNTKKADRNVQVRFFANLCLSGTNENSQVIRSGQHHTISIYDIQVGDVLRLQPGDVVAADGVFIQGHNVKCDESSATGESDVIKKARLQDCLMLQWLMDPEVSCSFDSSTLVTDSGADDNDLSTTISDYINAPSDFNKVNLPDPFIISGSKVIEGIGTFIVTAVGVNSFHGKTLMALHTEDEDTPLQKKLNAFAEDIAKIGLTAAGLLFFVLVVQCGVDYSIADTQASTTEIISQIMHILTIAITVIVVAVPEGLPLTVTLAFAYASHRMLKDNNLVRALAACETMGNATSICSDKTGTLTQNRMTVVAGTFGSSFRFSDKPSSSRKDLVDLKDIKYTIPPSVCNFMNQAIIVNSTSSMTMNADGTSTFTGSETEAALLTFAKKHLEVEPYAVLKSRWHIEQIFPFSSTIKIMGSVIRVRVFDENTKSERLVYRLHIKGASEILLDHCSRIISMHASSYYEPENKEKDNDDIETRAMTESNRERVAKIIHSYATQCLRTITLCFRDFTTWPSNKGLEEVIAEGGLTFLGIVGIEDPLRQGVKSAVHACHRAGVCVRMVTGDHMMTAKSIARQCGIYTYGTLAMDGPSFRKLPRTERLKILPNLRVLARSSPEDKRMLVNDLKESGEIVAVTGDGTNDAPALKAADVGFSMGLAGTEVAKEASSIVLLDDNFTSIVRAIAWGRCVNDSVKKFLQFQLTVNITALVLTLISAVASNEHTSALTAVQLLWVNLIMDTFGALALATDPPTPDLLQRVPEPRSAPLVNRSMWKMIFGQSLYQISLTLAMLYTDILQLADDAATLRTIVFTTFVFCQIFNQVNCRRIDNQLNILKNIKENDFFIVIFAVSVFGQVLIVECGGAAFQTTSLSIAYWTFSIAAGFLSIPIGAMIRMISDELFPCSTPTT